MSEDTKELNETQKLWADTYLCNNFNQSNASRVAYPGCSCPAQIGAENYRKPYIKAYIQERIKERLKGRDELQEQWLQEVMAISFSDPTENISIITETEIKPILNLRGEDTGNTEEIRTQKVKIKDTKDANQSKAIKSIKEDRFGVITVEYHDKTKGLDLLGKYLTLFTDKKEIDLTSGGLPILNITTIPDIKE